MAEAISHEHMNISVRSALPLALAGLVFAGAGCLGAKPSTKTAVNDGGVFRTVDASNTWSPLAAVPTAKGVGSLAGANILVMKADPQDPAVLYAGTRENGLFYSIDGGSMWERPRAEALRDGAIPALAVDPKSVCTVYVAKGPRLLKSADCLRSFDNDAFVETRPKISVVDVAVDWYNPKTVWLVESNGDVQKSEDAGKTWRRSLSTAVPATTVAVSQADSRVVLVGTNGGGFFRTADGGAEWKPIDDQLKKLRGADNVFALSQDAKGQAVFAATQYGLLRSVDNGNTWEPLQLLTTPGQVKIQALAVGPASADTIAYATPGTFYRSTDGGKNWTTHQLPSGRLPSRLIADSKNPLIYSLGFLAPVK